MENYNISEVETLKNDNYLFDNETVGYKINGEKISEKSFVSDIHIALELYEKGELKTFSSDEVRKIILG